MSSVLCAIMEREIIGSRNMIKTAFGAKLAERIRAEGMEPKDFIVKSGIKQANVYRWLKGSRPSPASAVAVAQFFDEDPATWLRLAKYPVGNPEDPNEADQEWLTLGRNFPWLREVAPDLANLNPKNRKIIENLIKNLGAQDGDAAQ